MYATVCMIRDIKQKNFDKQDKRTDLTPDVESEDHSATMLVHCVMLLFNESDPNFTYSRI